MLNICKWLLVSISFVFPLVACASSPHCDGKENWAASMAFVHLKNANIFTNENIDFSKTEVLLLASELKGDGLYLQLHKVNYYKNNGAQITVITENMASASECSESPVKVYLVSEIYGA